MASREGRCSRRSTRFRRKGRPRGGCRAYGIPWRDSSREGREEGGLDPADYVVVRVYRDDHGPWAYTYVLARAGSREITVTRNKETSGWGCTR